MKSTSRLIRAAVFGLPFVKSSLDSISGFKSRSAWIVIAATSVPATPYMGDTHPNSTSYYVCSKGPPSISTFAAAMPVGAHAFAFFPFTMHHR